MADHSVFPSWLPRHGPVVHEESVLTIEDEAELFERAPDGLLPYPRLRALEMRALACRARQARWDSEFQRRVAAAMPTGFQPVAVAALGDVRVVPAEVLPWVYANPRP